MKTITITSLRTKPVTRNGVIQPVRIAYHHNAEIVPGVSIRLYGTDTSFNADTQALYDRTFKIGDTAEYDSYNLHYLGKIVSISEKTIVIQEVIQGEHTTNHRLSLFDFDRRNHDLDLEAIAIINADVMACC